MGRTCEIHCRTRAACSLMSSQDSRFVSTLVTSAPDRVQPLAHSTRTDAVSFDKVAATRPALAAAAMSWRLSPPRFTPRATPNPFHELRPVERDVEVQRAPRMCAQLFERQCTRIDLNAFCEEVPGPADIVETVPDTPQGPPRLAVDRRVREYCSRIERSTARK